MRPQLTIKEPLEIKPTRTALKIRIQHSIPRIPSGITPRNATTHVVPWSGRADLRHSGKTGFQELLDVFPGPAAVSVVAFAPDGVDIFAIRDGGVAVLAINVVVGGLSGGE